MAYPTNPREDPKDPKISEANVPPASTGRPSRNLVLCFDGTANEFNHINTNVVKLVAMLEKEQPLQQRVYYQTGVGTYTTPGLLGPLSRWIAKTADLGVALYLDEHVKDGYKFLQSHWEPHDRICLFGFSRGAYTARALAGMLYTVGLLPRGMTEQVDFAYSIYKQGHQSAAYKQAFSRTITIEFIGVWDTVSSVGALYPRVLPFSANNNITKTFRHALSLDERRAKFRSNTWHLTPDPSDNPNPPEVGFFDSLWHLLSDIQAPLTWNQEALRDREELDKQQGLFHRPPTDVLEVWFPGSHSDVGGGNTPDFKDEDRRVAQNMLSNIPLRWMIKEIIAADTGIIFREEEMSRYGIDYKSLEDQAHREKAKKESLLRRESDPVEAIERSEAEIVYDRKSPMYLDATKDINDEMTRMPLWWLLELFPFIESEQDEHNHWIHRPRMNLGRGRAIPPPPAEDNVNSVRNKDKSGVNITDKPALFHVSAKIRMEDTKCNTRSWRSMWLARDQRYKPAAWSTHGKPFWVE
ncbi:hypothetical protein BS47DRAFT_1341434 [Hydnum rufescens UP504]|uniref:T6SS Phospholipase effector Tle1-like catalytic domain-containing protein n=1 Tax=Hydnum rufescens UP504 TaxID=1448309 RepID=A0A9P6B1K9_9AGAM|nr:hypothetical protein BS47DRAFT_1341434 [Hydnum rufescens UP504]